MLGLDLNLLGSLAVLLQTRSVSEAARRRRMSQPAMSRALAELRTLLNDPLLVRTRGGMLLTRRAEELAGPLQAWLDEASRLVDPPQLDPATLVRRFRVAAGDFAVQSVLRAALPEIAARAPGVAIDISAATSDAVARLATGEVDLLISGVEPDRRLVHERHLLREALVCLVRAGHPLTDRRIGGAPRIDQLLDWPQVSFGAGEGEDPLERERKRHGLEGRIVATTPYFAAARDLLLCTDSVMVLPERAAREHAGDGDLRILAAPAELGAYDHWLMWHTRSQRDPALAWLTGLLATLVEEPGNAPCLIAAE